MLEIDLNGDVENSRKVWLLFFFWYGCFEFFNLGWLVRVSL